MDMSLFTKCDVGTRDYSHEGLERITLHDRGLTVSSALNRKLGYQAGDRLDLYKMGSTFALKKDNVGLLKVTTSKGYGGAKITSKGLVLEIRATVGQCEFETWIEDGVLLFKPKAA